MKRIISVLLAFVLTLSLVACGSNTTNETVPPQDEQVTNEVPQEQESETPAAPEVEQEEQPVETETVETPTPTPEQTETPEPTPEVEPTTEPEETPEITPSVEPTPTPEQTTTPEVTPTPDPEPTPSVEVPPTPEPTPTPEQTETPEEEETTPAEGAITITQGQASSRPAKAGDTYVKADGTKVVLKVGPNGILGEGQGVAPDANLSVKKAYNTNSNFNRDGSFTYDRTSVGVLTDSLGKDLQNQKYLVNKTTGEGHWTNEWNAIRADYPQPKENGTYDGQVSSDPYSLYVWYGVVGWMSNFEH